MWKIYLWETLVAETSQGGGWWLAYKWTYCFTGCNCCSACWWWKYCLFWNWNLLCCWATLSSIVACPGYPFMAVYSGASCCLSYPDVAYVSRDSCNCTYSNCPMYAKNTAPQLWWCDWTICRRACSSSTSNYHPLRYLLVDVYALNKST